MKSIHTQFTRRHLLATGLLVIAYGGNAHAASISWKGVTDASWGTLTNWSTGGLPGTGDSVYFDSNSTANLSTTLGANNYTIQGIFANSGLTGDVTIASTGGVLTFNGNGIAWYGGTTKNLSISANVVVNGANEAWWAETGTTVALSGTVALNTYVFIRGSNTNSSAVTTGTFVFSNNVTVASGKAVYVGDSNYDGNMEITGGIFDSTVGSDWFVGQNSGNSNGTLTISGSGQLKYSTNSILYVGNSSATGTVTISGSGTLEAATSTQSIILGRAGGTGTLNLDGGTLFTSRSIRGSNYGTGTGTVNFNGGTLKAKDGNNADWLLSASTFNAYVKGNGSTTNSGAVFDTNGYNMGTSVALQHYAAGSAIDGGLTKKGSGTLTLSGANTYTGVTTINGGTLQLSSSGQLGGGTYSQAISIAADSSLEINSSTAHTLSGVISGAGNLKSSGTLTLSGTNGYTGSTTVNGGTLSLNADAATVYGSFVMNGGNNTYALMLKADQFASGVVANFTSASGAWNRFEFRAKDQTFAGITTGTLSTQGGGVLQNSENNGYGNVTLTLNGDSSDSFYPVDGYVFNGHIRDSANAGSYRLSLVKSGTGTQTLIGAAITHTGATTVNAGTLKLSDTTGFNSNVTMNGGTLELSRPTGTWSFGKTITAGTGAGNLVKTGAGTVTLTAANTYTGATTISSGTLEIGGAGQLGSSGIYAGAVTITSGTMSVASSANQTLSGAISGAGSLTKSGGGTLTLSGNNSSFSGTTTVNGGILVVNSDAGSGSVTVNNVGSKLAGTGSISGATTLSTGTIHAVGVGAVGAVGNQSFGNLSYASGSIFEWDLNANSNTGAGTNFDAVTGTGSLTVTSGAIFKIVLGSGVSLANSFWNTPNSTKTWSNIFNGFTGLTGGFNTSNLEVTGGNTNGIGSFTISGTTLTWTAVPEPTSAVAGILLGAGLLRRRRAGRKVES